MEESFRVRLDKAFGSLAYSTATAPPSSSPRSLWCLTDDEIHRNPWNRDKEQSEPESEADLGFKAAMIKDLEDIDDDDEEEEEEQGRDNQASRDKKPKPADYNDEEWDIKNSIGLDCTLDYEEEEDEYDQVAVSNQQPEHCLFMSNVTDYGIDIDSGTVLPNSLKDVARDPRANHMAAKIRLEEDAEAARKMDSLWVVENDSSSGVNKHIHLYDDDNLQSILKRKDDMSDSKLHANQVDLKSEKRVRFDPECSIDGHDKESDSVKDKQLEAVSADYPSGVPDYMENPWRYTCYTFDKPNDVDEETNRQAYSDFLEMLKKPNAMGSGSDDRSLGTLMPVTFIPKRRNCDTAMVDDIIRSNQNGVDFHEESMHRRGLSLAIAAEDTQDGEVCCMEVDEPEMVNDRKQRSGRRYRARPKSEVHE